MEKVPKTKSASSPHASPLQKTNLSKSLPPTLITFSEGVLSLSEEIGNLKIKIGNQEGAWNAKIRDKTASALEESAKYIEKCEKENDSLKKKLYKAQKKKQSLEEELLA